MPMPFAKATCYDHGTRTPLLISWPGMGQPREFTDLTTHMDLVPTICDLLGVPSPQGLDGVSWLSSVIENAPFEREFTFSYVNTLSSGYAFPMRAIQDSRYALVFSSWAGGELKYRSESMIGLTFNAMAAAAASDPRIAARVSQYIDGIPLAFYDLQDDPGQRSNIIVQPRHADRVRRMTEALLHEMRRTGDPELGNLETLLAGGVPVVTQDIERYRLRDGD
jgi:N-sulfoglucosamine sulfohydrolase